MPNATPLISLNDVSIRRQNEVVFQGLCWDIGRDQHWAVIGPNGSGKSTLLKALCGALPIVKGRLVYHLATQDGNCPFDQIAYVAFDSQESAPDGEAFYQARWNVGILQDSPTVSEVLSEQGVRRTNPYQVVEGRAEATFEARRQEVIKRLELEPLVARQFLALSNGERRKVAIAQALLTNPRLLILDSPFVGLDERFRVRLMETFEHLMQGEMRLIIAGTSRDELPPSITHVLNVSDNRVISQGPRQAISKSDAADGRQHTSRLADVRLAPEDERQNDTAPGKILVRMKDVNVSYNGTQVLRQVNWTVRENERWAVLGPNGAGKTTLLSLILGDNPQAYANDITLFGRPRGSGESIWEIKRNIGWVAPELHVYYPRNAKSLQVVCSGWFDSVGLFRECSVEQREIAEFWLERFGLGERADAAFGELGEAEQRLTLLARALVKNPILLVLDEPCQGLDAANRDRVIQAVDVVGSRADTSLIYVTHRADDLAHAITHVLRLDAGQVVEQGAKRA